MNTTEAKRIFAHCTKYGTRGFTKTQIIKAWGVLRQAIMTKAGQPRKSRNK